MKDKTKLDGNQVLNNRLPSAAPASSGPASAGPAARGKVDVLARYELRLSSTFVSRHLNTPADAGDRGRDRKG